MMMIQENVFDIEYVHKSLKGEYYGLGLQPGVICFSSCLSMNIKSVLVLTNQNQLELRIDFGSGYQ